MFKHIKPAVPHILALLGFVIVASIFFSPSFQGKELIQSDNIQLAGTNKEITEFREKGETIRWTNREFGGLPVAVAYKFNPFRLFGNVIYNVNPRSITTMLCLLMGFYVLAMAFKISPLMTFIFSLAFGFSTFNLLSIEAGHDNKVLSMALMPVVLAGVVLVYDRKLILGVITTFLGGGMLFYFGHIQITYYTLIIVLGYFLYILVISWKKSQWRNTIYGSVILALTVISALGFNYGKLAALSEYSSYSTRGGTELSSGNGRTGLSKEYATAWSNGKSEIFTIIFPYFHGGASREQLSESSTIYRALKGQNVPEATIEQVLANVPLYWGDQPFTGGPLYFGAIVCVLFLLGLLIVKDPMKWWILIVTILALLLSMGKNLSWFTDFFFNYIPLYNKFRSVTMIMSIAQLLIALFAAFTIDRLLESDISLNDLKSVGIKFGLPFLGLSLFFMFFKSALFDFQGLNDANLGFPNWLLIALEEDRKDQFDSSILRSLLFISSFLIALVLRQMKKLNLQQFSLILMLLILGDLWVVNKRYLNSKDFRRVVESRSKNFQPTVADMQIKNDESYFRVLNTTVDPFSDGTTSYHHFSIGGYSAIKMQRYQEIVDTYLRNADRSVLNMLNTKYFIVQDNAGNPIARINSDALGNAWFVKRLVIVKNADDELNLLNTIPLQDEALVDERFSGYLEGRPTEFNSTGEISLNEYHPERLSYDFHSATEQFVVFSELFYGPGWKAYIDGQLASHIRVNYVLRGMYIPEGEHEIQFRFQPPSATRAGIATLSSTLLLLITVLGSLFVRKKYGVLDT